MQYLLTEEELAAVKEKARVEAIKRFNILPEKEMQKLCSNIADYMPVQEGWYKGKVWGCILTKRKNDEWYCDDCPVRKICPNPHKSWSK